MKRPEEVSKGLKEIKRVGKGRFILSVLKKSPNIDLITDLINKNFKVKEVVEEARDIIFII